MAEGSIQKHLRKLNLKKKFGKKYYCKRCGACISEQPNFKEHKDSWICAECGTTLYYEDLKNERNHMEDLLHGNGDFVWHCECCGMLLNFQDGFEEDCGVWQCTKCGYMNHINLKIRKKEEEKMEKLRKKARKEHKEAIEKEIEKNSQEETGELEEPAEDHYHNAVVITGVGENASGSEKSNETEKSKPKEEKTEEVKQEEVKPETIKPETVKQETEKDKSTKPEVPKSKGTQSEKSDEEKGKTGKKRTDSGINKTIKKIFKSYWKIILIFAIIILGTTFISSGIEKFTKMIPVGQSFGDMVGRNYKDVMSELSKQGFNNIDKQEMEDLGEENMDQDQTVYEVTIDGSINFSQRSKYHEDVQIIIQYHSPKRLVTILSSEEIKGMNYVNVEKKFRESGFKNIETKPIYDLSLGFLTKDGEIEEISIGGQTEFDEYLECSPDDEIVIWYHTFKKNEGKEDKDKEDKNEEDQDKEETS